MLAAAKPNKFITLNRKDLRKMENENINTNATDTQMNSTNESKSESFANEALTANTNYGTISASDIENGTAELVLIPPFEGDDGGISVACVEGTNESQVIELPINELRYSSAYVDETNDKEEEKEDKDKIFIHTFRYKFTTASAGNYYIRTTKMEPYECIIYSNEQFTSPLSNDKYEVLNGRDQICIKANLDEGTTYYLKITACECGTFGTLISSRDTGDVCVADLNNADPNDIDSERRLIIYSMPNNSLTEGTVSSGTELKLHTFYPRDDEWYYVEGDFLKNGQTVHDWGWCKGKYLGNYVNYATAKENSILVRSGPSTKHNKIGDLNKDSLVEILEKNCKTDDLNETTYTKWHKIRYIGSDGYVFAGFFTDKPHWTPFFCRNISENGKEMLKRLEGFKQTAYKALPTEPNFTIGYGHLITDGSESVTINGKSYDRLTEDLAIDLLNQDLSDIFIPQFNDFLKNNNILLSQNQYDACVMDCFQKGQNIWKNQKRSIAQFIVGNQYFYDYSQVLTAFLDGATNEGLKNRRTREAKLFVYNIYS
jgi:GH24 family phage-related lysozyme (muramidase)